MRKIKSTHLFILLTGIVLLFTNSCKSKTEEKETPDYVRTNDEIELAENSVIEPKLKVETAKYQFIESELNSNGTVKAIPERFAEVAAPFGGRVTKSFVTIGQYVRKGDPIFEMKSSDFFAAQQDYFSAQQEMKQAEINLKRQKDLLAHSVGVKREMEEAETEYKLKKIAVEQLAASLKVFNSSAQTKMGQSLIVRSPIAGRVVNSDLVVGQYLKDDHEALVTVAELSKVWISAQVKEKDLGFLTELKNIKFSVDAFSSKEFNGQIVNIGQMLNEETRSVDVLIETENIQSLLKPGMYVNVVLNSVGKEEIVLPTKAVFQENENQYVFVKIGQRKFRKTKVKTVTMAENSQSIRIVDGLTAGQNIVVDGGIYLMGAK